MYERRAVASARLFCVDSEPIEKGFKKELAMLFFHCWRIVFSFFSFLFLSLFFSLSLVFIALRFFFWKSTFVWGCSALVKLYVSSTARTSWLGLDSPFGRIQSVSCPAVSLSVFLCLSVCLICVCRSFYLSVCIFAYLFVFKGVCVSVYV